jgi:hypothetical protein
LFIIYYCNPESETFDNGLQSYKKAYSSKNDNVCAVEAHSLLSQDKIQEAIDRYRVYIHEKNGFELDWLDNHLKNLFYRVLGKDDKIELATLKTIGNRLGAFKDAIADTSGKVVEMSPETEKLANKLFADLIAEQKKSGIETIERLN